MIKALLVAAIVLAGATPASGPIDSARAADVAELEHVITLPNGAEPLAAYARYYTTETLDHHEMLRGYFVLEGPDAPGSYLHQSPVDVADGGCTVVTIYFDLKTRLVAGVFCNGLA